MRVMFFCFCFCFFINHVLREILNESAVKKDEVVVDSQASLEVRVLGQLKKRRNP